MQNGTMMEAIVQKSPGFFNENISWFFLSSVTTFKAVWM